jgi:hypothetical protein
MTRLLLVAIVAAALGAVAVHAAWSAADALTHGADARHAYLERI